MSISTLRLAIVLVRSRLSFEEDFVVHGRLITIKGAKPCYFAEFDGQTFAHVPSRREYLVVLFFEFGQMPLDPAISAVHFVKPCVLSI